MFDDFFKAISKPSQQVLKQSGRQLEQEAGQLFAAVTKQATDVAVKYLEKEAAGAVQKYATGLFSSMSSEAAQQAATAAAKEAAASAASSSG